MKRKMALLAAMMMVILTFAACGSTNESELQAEPEEQEPAGETAAPESTESDQSEKFEGGNDTLVVYFSRTGEQYEVGVIDKGNTAIVAEMIAESTGADSFEILPKEDKYPDTYDELTEAAKQEQNEKARPAIAGEIPDLSKYRTVFIGAPVWWGDWPMIMYTFFEENTDALAGKTLVPFSTHAGSGLFGFDTKLASACPESTIGEGLAIAGRDAQNDQESVGSEVNEWLEGLGY